MLLRKDERLRRRDRAAERFKYGQPGLALVLVGVKMAIFRTG